MQIEGIGLASYRSFGSEMQLIGPLNKINLFIGQNNSGKSNILRFLANHYEFVSKSARGQSGGIGFGSIDRHLGEDQGTMQFAFGMKLEGEFYQNMLKANQKNITGYYLVQVDSILRSKALTHGTQMAWFPYIANWKYDKEAHLDQFLISAQLADNLLAEGVINHSQWRELFSRFTGNHHGEPTNWVSAIIHQLSVEVKNHLPRVHLISAIRRVGEPGSPISDDDFSGPGIIDRLAKLQNPAHDQQHLRKQFEEINGFLREVTENYSATLEIPYPRDTILVHMDNKVLPLSSLGTGIHEVVILAAAATILTDQVVCLEEPELHLHPFLQKKLLRYLYEKTTNQYFIATHSAHILDSSLAAIFHVRYRDGKSLVENVLTSPNKSVVLADLGYRASDLLQTNCIIWVEGPSDRIYVNHWIAGLDDKKELIEGVHYSIMFYGGRLRSHLSAFDPEMLDSEIEDFISLRRINRNMVILIDSDKSQENGALDHTKQRLMREFGDEAGFAWLTCGREVENYVSPEVLLSAIQTVHPKAQKLYRTGQYHHIFYYQTDDGTIVKKIDKVKVALEVVKRGTVHFDVFDLKEKVEKLVRYIRDANGIGL